MNKLLIILLLLFSVSPAIAINDPYPLGGYIRHENNTIVPNVDIIITNENTAQIIYATSSSSGWYTQDAANFGNYANGQIINYTINHGNYNNTTFHTINTAVGSNTMDIFLNIIVYPPCIINIRDSCGNMITDGTLNVNILNTSWNYHYTSNPISLNASYFIDGQTDIWCDMYTHSWTLYTRIYPNSGTTINHEDNKVEWDLKITVRDNITNAIIPTAQIDLDYGCKYSGDLFETKYSDSSGEISLWHLVQQPISYNLSKTNYNDKINQIIDIAYDAQTKQHYTTIYMDPVGAIYNFKDECGNMMKNGYMNISINNTDTSMTYAYTCNPVVLNSDWYSEGDLLKITSSNALGSTVWWDNCNHGTEEDLTDLLIAWTLKVVVYAGNIALPEFLLPNATVNLSVGCRLNGDSLIDSLITEYDGVTPKFYNLSAQPINYHVTALGFEPAIGVFSIHESFSPYFINWCTAVGMTPLEPMTFNFKDECNNMLKSGNTNIEINNTLGNIHNYNTNPVSFSEIYFNASDPLRITSTVFSGNEYWDVSGSHGTTTNMISTLLDWNLEITVRNETDNTIISNAKVDMAFGCRCNSGATTATQYTGSLGKTSFGDVANQNPSYTLTRAGYTTKTGSISVAFSPQTEDYGVTLYMTPVSGGDPDPPDPDPNPPDPEDPENTSTSVYFTDMDDVVQTQFNNDVDTEFKLWCRNKNHVDATLTFEFYNETTSMWENIDTWTLVANAYNTYTIPATNFTRTGSYQGKLVTDVQDIEIISIIDNTLYYNIKCYTYINGTSEPLNGTSVNIGGVDTNTGIDNYVAVYKAEGNYDIYAHKTGYVTTIPAEITLDGADLTVLLYLDPVEVFYSFTIDVYDTNLIPILYTTVYLEGYTFKGTGASNQAVYAGLPSGDYRFKASKIGYFSIDWINTTIMSSDISESVFLTETTFTADIDITTDGRAGKVNETTDHEVDIFIDSNNDSKYNTTIVFYRESIEYGNITLTKINFTDNHFIWQPISFYHYCDGYNYYAKLFDDSSLLLCEDTVYCDDPAVSTHNFTVIVYDSGGLILNGATVHLSGEGTCGCGSTNWCTHTDLTPDTYTYYVSKTGYISSTPADVTIINQDLETDVYLTIYTPPETYDLTINVFNETGTALTGSIVYISGKTPINTGTTNYGVYTGLSEGTYQYKASKSGYITSGLSNVEITTSDKSVNINLILQSETEPYTTTKMSDQEIKDLYLPFMYFIMVALLIGACASLMRGKF